MGTVVISLDAELAWGYHDLDPLPREKFDTARDSWRRLVDAFEEFGVPATWAVVGHLLLAECDGTHATHAAPDGWFRRDPGGTAADNPDWFGPDLVEAVRDSPVDHEIASHSFSHLEFGRSGTTSEMARAEVTACLDLARERGIDLRTFVFPRNAVGHLDVLADHGFRNYRTTPERPFSRFGMGRAAKLLEYGLGLGGPPVDPPRVDAHGLVRHPASQYLFAFEEPARSLLAPVRPAPVCRRARRGIDRAIATDGVFHLWFHPNELRSESDHRRVRSVLEYIDRRRDDLRVATMAEVGAEVRGD